MLSDRTEKEKNTALQNNNFAWEIMCKFQKEKQLIMPAL